MQLYRIDLNLDSLLRRACQRLKLYILNDPNQTTESAIEILSRQNLLQS